MWLTLRLPGDFLGAAKMGTPQLAAAATPVADATGLERLVIGVAIHVGQHQDVSRLLVLSDHGY